MLYLSVTQTLDSTVRGDLAYGPRLSPGVKQSLKQKTFGVYFIAIKGFSCWLNRTNSYPVWILMLKLLVTG